MLNNQNIFNKKKILVYGLGKSGLSTFKFLKSIPLVNILFDFINKILPLINLHLKYEINSFNISFF